MKKIVITGLGMVTPVGNGKVATWNALKAGKCGIGRGGRHKRGGTAHRGARKRIFCRLCAERAQEADHYVRARGCARSPHIHDSRRGNAKKQL